MPLALTTVLADLPDPRMETTNKLHKLTDILVIATCAVIAGADWWEEIAVLPESLSGEKAGRSGAIPDAAPRDAFSGLSPGAERRQGVASRRRSGHALCEGTADRRSRPIPHHFNAEKRTTLPIGHTRGRSTRQWDVAALAANE